jgi:glutamate carboxypeptidase
VLRNADYDEIEKKIREAIKKQLLPEAEVEMTFTRRRPPLQASAASRALATRAQAIYRELGRELVVDELPEGGGTDAAFAALDTKGPVIERLGLRGYGEHSANAEYVLLDSIEPRLYLLARLIMDVSQSAGQLKP